MSSPPDESAPPLMLMVFSPRISAAAASEQSFALPTAERPNGQLVRAEVLHYGAEVEMVAPEGLREAVKGMVG